MQVVHKIFSVHQVKPRKGATLQERRYFDPEDICCADYVTHKKLTLV